MVQHHLRSGLAFALAQTVENMGEFLIAAGETGCWGLQSVEADLPTEQQETTEVWLRRRISALRGALDSLEAALGEGKS